MNLFSVYSNYTAIQISLQLIYNECVLWGSLYKYNSYNKKDVQEPFVSLSLKLAPKGLTSSPVIPTRPVPQECSHARWSGVTPTGAEGEAENQA